MKEVNQNDLPALLNPLGGGYYIGSIMHNGQPHAVIRAPKAEGHFIDVVWGEFGVVIEGAGSYTDGLANTDAMAAAGSEAAQKVRALRIGGHDDWAIPARDQLELGYRNAKPTAEDNICCFRDGENPSAIPPTHPYTEDSPAQTSVPKFREGGSEAFDAAWYWASTQYSAISAWCQHFGSGSQGHLHEDNRGRVVAVRMIPIINSSI